MLSLLEQSDGLLAYQAGKHSILGETGKRRPHALLVGVYVGIFFFGGQLGGTHPNVESTILRPATTLLGITLQKEACTKISSAALSVLEGNEIHNFNSSTKCL